MFIKYNFISFKESRIIFFFNMRLIFYKYLELKCVNEIYVGVLCYDKKVNFFIVNRVFSEYLL